MPNRFLVALTLKASASIFSSLAFLLPVSSSFIYRIAPRRRRARGLVHESARQLCAGIRANQPRRPKLLPCGQDQGFKFTFGICIEVQQVVTVRARPWVPSISLNNKIRGHSETQLRQRAARHRLNYFPTHCLLRPVSAWTKSR